MSSCQQFDLFGNPITIVQHKKHVYADAKRIRIEESVSIQTGFVEMSDEQVYASELSELEALRPKTRGDCHSARKKIWKDHPEAEMRELAPCPWLSCKHHLWFDVEGDDDELRDTVDARLPAVEHSCALDVVDISPDGLLDHEVGAILGMTDEMVRQMNERSLVQLRKKPQKLGEYGVMTTQYVSQMEKF